MNAHPAKGETPPKPRYDEPAPVSGWCDMRTFLKASKLSLGVLSSRLWLLSLALGVPACGAPSDPSESEDEETEESKDDDSDSDQEDSGESENEPAEEDEASSGKKDDDASESPEKNDSSSEKDKDKDTEKDKDAEKDEEPEEEEKKPEPKSKFEDKALRACVKEAAGSLDAKALAKLTYLDCHARGIVKLGGLGQLSALEHLTLFENKVTDIGPIGHLTKLQSLQLGNNQLTDISALEALTELKTLSLVVNQVQDLSALQKLSALENLNLDANQIKDIAPLTKLSGLKWLTLDNNQIADKSAIEGLKSKIELVYGDLQGKGGWSSVQELVSSELRSNVAPPTGELRLRALPDQSFDLDFLTDAGLRIETAKEWWGSLSRKGSTLWLTQGKTRRAVGRVEGERLRLCHGRFAKACDLAVGIKMPNTPGGGGEPSVSVNLELRDTPDANTDRFLVSDPMQKHESLLPFVFSAPNQYDAGSCAYMAATGTMEILLNQKDKVSKLDYGGKNNLSEPFMMNVGGSRIPYFFTDSMYNFNGAKAALPDKYMPFGLSSSGSAQKNWNAKIPSDWKSNATPVPRVERTVLFYDPPRNSNSKWNVGLMDQKIVERIKYALRSTDAPVMAVYNHNGYWHVSIIVGYDDTQEHGECPMVKSSIKSLKKQGKSQLIGRIEAHMKKLGGCSKKGNFLVRDSIYPGSAKDEPYTYGGAKSNGRYSRRIIKREYEWIWYLANHVTSVYRASGADAPSGEGF